MVLVNQRPVVAKPTSKEMLNDAECDQILETVMINTMPAYRRRKFCRGLQINAFF